MSGHFPSGRQQLGSEDQGAADSTGIVVSHGSACCTQVSPLLKRHVILTGSNSEPAKLKQYESGILESRRFNLGGWFAGVECLAIRA